MLSRIQYMTKHVDDAAILGDSTTLVNAEEDQEEQASTLLLQTTDEEGTLSPSAEVALALSSKDITTNNGQDWFSLWKKRLITSEDAFSVHKLAAIVYTITSFTMVGTAAGRWLFGRQELFAVLPAYLEPMTYLFCLANLVMCTASIRMAWIHRRNDLASRNAFVGTAGSSILSGYFLLWASPFAPESMTTASASQLGFGLLVLWNLLFVTDTMIRAADIIEGRRDKKSEEENASFALEYIRYIATGAWGLPVVAATGYINCVAHDHSWLMSVFDDAYNAYGHGLQASVFYNNVLASMAAAYGSLAVTLRDKKLISKRTEWAGIVVFSVPALVWTIDVSARILPYVFSDGAAI